MALRLRHPWTCHESQAIGLYLVVFSVETFRTVRGWSDFKEPTMWVAWLPGVQNYCQTVVDCKRLFHTLRIRVIVRAGSSKCQDVMLTATVNRIGAPIIPDSDADGPPSSAAGARVLPHHMVIAPRTSTKFCGKVPYARVNGMNSSARLPRSGQFPWSYWLGTTWAFLRYF